MLHLADAETVEHGTPSSNYVITPLQCAIPSGGGPRYLGGHKVRIVPGTRLSQLCGTDSLEEEFFCNYGVNLEYLERLQAAGLVVSAQDDRGEIRAVEVADHPFFIATLFQPQLSAKAAEHPVIQGFLRAASEFAQKRNAASASTA